MSDRIRSSSSSSSKSPSSSVNGSTSSTVESSSDVTSRFENISLDDDTINNSLDIAASAKLKQNQHHSSHTVKSMEGGASGYGMSNPDSGKAATNLTRNIFRSGSLLQKGVIRTPSVVRNTQTEVSLTRQKTLPPKNPKEDQKHLKEYEAMMKAAKKKEQKRAEEVRKRKIAKEKRMLAALTEWEADILPNWNSRKNNKKTHELWWQGIPSRVRGLIWQKAVGNEVNITKETFELCQQRAKALWSKSPREEENGSQSPLTTNSNENGDVSKQILLDISRTFPTLGFFQETGPYHEKLKTVLEAFVCFRPEIGYVQGMSYIVATLLLNMEEFEAFVCLINILKGGVLLVFYSMDIDKISGYFRAFMALFREHVPELAEHFIRLGIKPDYFLYEWWVV
ncbi:rab-GTPase-TBC domain-containing protein [Paraphysoderma sedebokerense]|nr:rab-GTPase-TBC domain-containing protein [Paraphysoderma sedebokerense]